MSIVKHFMKLKSDPFIQISNGTKTIELRLNDEKRQRINEGDEIEFSSLETNEKINVIVKKKYLFYSFEDLYSELPLLKCGYTKDNVNKADPHDMNEYYTYDQQFQNGVVGIEIQLKGI